MDCFRLRSSSYGGQVAALAMTETTAVASPIAARYARPQQSGRRQMTEENSVLVDREGPVTIISINRPHCRNAVDGATARKLYDAFLAFDADKDASVAVF